VKPASLATTTKGLVSPQRSIIAYTQLCQGTGGEPFRIPLASHGKLDDPRRDKFGQAITRASGKLKPGAHSLKGPVHGLDMLDLECEIAGRGSWHGGAADV
jgi:hypothetical protein